ncbi:MAG TPA: 30S ribosomal protein S17 [Dehalococcoidia bacterium]|jgi:small subunit ribosomal protein S17|nr:30S ribosomal protein S17 [SAR202 cluster bacterium]HIM90614.1 30S ribosomal protein S17 [Dehalococcoidia bacterium]|tara:strand:+ start:693 stop:1103 length:411 start_codon:yes stop_codon:yes gene_type:complete
MSYERRKVRIGRVVSDKMDKTVIVAYGWSTPHPIYKKAMRRETRFMTHDPENQAKLGDVVRIVESRPISKTKRWKLAEILSSREIAELQPEEIQVDESVASAAATSALDQAEAAESASTTPDAESTSDVDSEEAQG